MIVLVLLQLNKDFLVTELESLTGLADDTDFNVMAE